MPSSSAVTAKRRRAQDTQTSLQDAAAALAQAQAFLWSQQRSDGLWCGDVEAGPDLTAMYVIASSMLGTALDAPCAASLGAYLSRRQRRDGGWASGRGAAHDLSCAALAFLALRLLGYDPQGQKLSSAQKFILDAGGLAQLDAPSRGIFALYGLVPWDMAPMVPLERTLAQGMFLPAWARRTWVPWSIIGFNQPVIALPNGRHRRNPWLDALWLPQHKQQAKATSRGASGPMAWVRAVALRRATAWVLQQQSSGGLWPGGAVPTMVSLVALHLQDCYAHAEPVQRGVQALRQLLWEEGGSTHLQPTRAVVRDTATSVMGLYSGSKLRSEPRLQHTVEGLIDWQFPDLQVAALLRQPQTAPHALRARWSRRMHAAWHPLLQRRLRRWRGRVSWRSAAGWAASSQAPAPEVETTAEVLLAALQHAPQSSITQPVRRGIWWLLAAQARDGGWHACGGAAGPWQRMRGYASPIALAAPQVTAGALEALAMWQHRVPLAASYADPALAHLRRRARAAGRRAVRNLRSLQDAHGAWSSGPLRLHVQPTGQVLCGLRQAAVARGDTMVEAALRWLRDNQQADGGWAERTISQTLRRLPGEQKSAPVATAWALLGMLAYLQPHDDAVERAMVYLVQRQVGPGRGRCRDIDGARPMACGKTWRDNTTVDHDAASGLPTRPRLLQHNRCMQALARYVAACDADV